MNNKACHLQRKSSNLSNVTNFPFPPTQATTSSVTADKFLPTTGYPTLASSTRYNCYNKVKFSVIKYPLVVELLLSVPGLIGFS